METKIETSPQALISVVIPAHNEVRRITRALESIAEQDYTNIETIVVANACTDGTAGIARSFIDQELGRMGEVIEVPEKGISLAKNRGFEYVAGDIIVYLDADTIAAPNLLAKTAESVKVGFLAGKTLVYPDEETPAANLYWRYVRSCSRLSEHLPTSNGDGGFLFAYKWTLMAMITKSQTDSKPGFIFDENLERMEDVDFQDRIKPLVNFKLIKDSRVTTSTRRCGDGSFADYYKVFKKDWKEYKEYKNYKKDLRKRELEA